ncbi:MAG: sigma 54-interacting transcriptional regulator [Myxococcales bacterium]|nr:sigma 54-interacting transcriptional regulator [Myxococcales bacterium]MCB9731786.1 sigma 54-interacting transcriptional regulator [Deltaproteobacteria bacterium]
MRTQTDVLGEWSRGAEHDPPGVRIVETPGQGAVDVRVPVDAPLLLGRDPGPKGVALLDPRVSSAHLTIYPGDGGELHFRDMNSKNGTFLNGHRVAAGVLSDGDCLRLGSTLLVVTRRGPAVDVEDPARDLVGQSPAFRETCARAGAGARAGQTLLLLGETGTGKEGLARYAHAQSGRSGPFIAVNCAALGGEMATATLFGHERGAFTGATASRRGLFREAEGGTLFLDEIGDLPLDVQPRLLRALEQLEVTPVGAARPTKVDVRVVAATNADLSEAVAAGTFRADLLARLSAWPVELAPLRERREDILRLARHFAGRKPADVPFGDPMFDADAAEVLLLFEWPFNIRELRQTVTWMMAHGRPPYSIARVPQRVVDGAVRRPPSPTDGVPGTQTAPLKVALPRRRRVRPSRNELLAALSEHDFNISAVARAFERDRKQIYRWVTHYGIPISDAGDDDDDD